MAEALIESGLILGAFCAGVAVAEHAYKRDRQRMRFRLRHAYDRQAELEGANAALTAQNTAITRQRLEVLKGGKASA